ncbi:Cd(II)/Pb(II)-responsive transcriptional regulator [Castellaniella defragrans]|uniref:Cd(II)/Pb(II)-responsive transcriptional regulator n=1 Tax=Castellaniella defragrans TaxID=75697 RepID=A0A7W9TL61_CASDE|nr:Cd(II)/Pb(II)-responsive transcriptional regulator [Castellaniella defragrans]KAB0601761.1 Cd(II)/Pb(II)-responsive transcriptional regulator [Castellaniella defragrans]MBB6082733.1 Cd(II)/Pb(II)-responsive transcriptional regulator [Castellaniella defragrans]
MKIGELARAARCSTETVRFYEKAGLLPAPARSEGNYRQYGPAHLERLRFIRNCRGLDMAHDEIRALLGMIDHPARDCGPINHLLDEHIAHVDVRLRELQDLQRQLVELREQCRAEQPVDACGIVQGLARMETADGPARNTHIG